MALRRLVLVLRRRGLLIVVAIGLSAAVGYHRAPPVGHAYSAQVIAISGLTSGQELGPQISYIAHSNLTLAVVARTPATAAFAVAATGVGRYPPAVAARTNAAPIPGTTLIIITVTDSDATIAGELADAMPAALDREVAVLHTGSAQGIDPLDIREYRGPVVTPAQGGSQRASNTALAALLGFLMAAGAALIVDHLDVTIRGVVDAERRLELPVLGSTHFGDRPAKVELIRPSEPARGRRRRARAPQPDPASR